MGAWSFASFGNDDAMDFLEEVEVDGDAAIANAFDVVTHLPDGEFLEAADACVALAAAELVAAALGKAGSDLPSQVNALVAKIRSAKTLRGAAHKSVRRVLEPGSELHYLWKAGTDYAPWRACVQDLMERLS